MTDQTESTVLVLGATGMLGNAVLRLLADSPGIRVVGSVRSAAGVRMLREDLRERVRTGVDVENPDSLAKLLGSVRPHAVINCVGLVKQLADAEDPLAALPVNALLPHRLSRLCALVGARLVHISTDCVFAGSKGMYLEGDPPDAQDLYGRSKLLGEVTQDAHAITLRTSIIGHELASAHGLVGWFLAQKGSVRGYRKAVFSGVPTVELARIIRDHVLPRPELTGLYQVSAAPIDKLTLLQLVANQYSHEVDIVADERVVIDRSLDSTRFRTATGYQPPEWVELVRHMHAFG
jgi:dTDP-4-dehydrorhamnose reductase